MYTTANLSEDIKALNSINNEIKTNLSTVDEKIKTLTIDDEYINCLEDSYNALEKYSEIMKGMNLQDIYSNEDSYSIELLETFKKVSDSNYKLKDIFNNFFENRDKFVKVYLLMTNSFAILESYVELDYDEKQQMYGKISNFFLKNKIKPFELDDDYAYVDNFCDVISNIDDYNISSYLNKVYEALNTEEENYQDDNKHYTESGYEDYNVVEKKEDDYEDIGDILKKMQRDNRRNGGF